MKIYCILCDGAPLTSPRNQLLQQKGFDTKLQVSNCFTTTSVISLLTGKMPSEIVKGGVGYKPNPSIYDDPHNIFSGSWHEIKEKPWHEQNLFHILKNEGWGLNLHNALWLKRIIYNDDLLNLSTSHPGGTTGESGPLGWDAMGPLVTNPEGNKNLIKKYLDDEKKAVNKMQSLTGNQLYFIKYHSYHAAYNNGNTGFDTAESLMNEVISYWDTDEEDSLFWFFSDHGNFNYIDNFCFSPHSWYTWVSYKDNIAGEKIKSNSPIIGIGDFFPTIIQRLNLDTKWEKESSFTPLSPLVNESRLFFVEDSRLSSPDPTKSTTASVIQPLYIEGKFSNQYLQVSYYNPTKSYKAVWHDINSNTLKEITQIPYNLVEALNMKFEWSKNK
jgi:hypothetical protein